MLITQHRKFELEPEAKNTEISLPVPILDYQRPNFEKAKTGHMERMNGLKLGVHEEIQCFTMDCNL